MKTSPVIQDSLEEALAMRSYKHEIPARRKKFERLTGHIKNDHLRRVTEVLCENQLSHTRRLSLEESTTSNDVALFKKYALRVIPRVYPAMFIRDLVSIQPIPLPNAKVFYKDFLKDPSGLRLDRKANFDRTYANRGSSPFTQNSSVLPTAVGPGSASTGEGNTPAKLKMRLTAADIVATSKALQYEFSAELNQDLRAYHGSSADPELGAEAANEIQREIEYDIVQKLLDEAGAGNVNWSVVPPANDQQKTLDTNAYNATIFNAIVDARNLVFKERYTYPNWMICHPDFAVRLEKLNGFEYDKSYDPAQIMQGRQFFGTIRNVIRIHVDPWFPTTSKAVLGYKGASDYEVGLVYSPYVSFYSTASFEDPDTLTTRKSLLSRQAISMLVPEQYSTVTLQSAS